MSIEVPSLNNLNSSFVAQELATAKTLVQELMPSMNLKRGVYHDNVLYSHALLAAAIRTNLARYLAARSIKDITADPSLADEGVVDGVLSNWGITRKDGSYAEGEVTIVLKADSPVTLSANTPLVAAGNLTFYTTQLFSAIADEALVTHSTDRLIVPLSDNRYAFTVTMRANVSGPAYNIKKDTLVTPASQPLNFDTAYATSDFTGGSYTETNDEMLNRLQQGIAAKGGSNIVNMAAYLRSIDAFSRIPSMTVMGFGDAEMLRDQHSIFPVSFGGRVDWYIRSQAELQRLRKTVTATMLSKTATSSVWQFGISRYDAPGFYEIRNIRLTSASNVIGGFDILSEVRSMDLTAIEHRPDIETLAEGAYTAFQTTTVQFTDTVTNTLTLSVGDTASYDIELVGMPLIGDIQTLINSHDVRCKPADVVVKAPTPCFVQVNFTIYRKAGDVDPDLAAIRTAVAAVVNDTGFIGRLYASQIIKVVQNYLTNDASVGKMDLFGRIRRPDGATVYLRDSDVLQVSDDPQNMTTANTVAFFAEPADIGISVAVGLPTPI